jgi:tRNA-specific 2-thiouridylase
VFAKVRSSRPPQPAEIVRDDERIEVELIAGEYGIAPGQACVLYDGPGDAARVLGGGFIEQTRPAADVLAAE